MEAPARDKVEDVEEKSMEDRAQQLKHFEKKLNALEQQIREQEIKVDLEDDPLSDSAEDEEAAEKPDSACKKCCDKWTLFSPKAIKREIPGKLQNHMRIMYCLFVFNAITLFMNWISMLTFFGANTTDAASSNSFLMPTLYVFIGIPASWFLWYRRLFVAVTTQSQTRFMIFNVNFIIHTLFVFIMALGFVSLGSAGVLGMTREIIKTNSSSSLQTLFVISCICWVIDTICSIFLFKKCFDVHNKIQYSKLIKEQNDHHSLS